jgi:hypothetical protein
MTEKPIPDSGHAARWAKSTRITDPMPKPMHYYTPEGLAAAVDGLTTVEEETVAVPVGVKGQRSPSLRSLFGHLQLSRFRLFNRVRWRRIS